MLQLTREQAITEHRKMWNWIADYLEASCGEDFITILNLKWLYFKRNNISPNDIPFQNCYCCDYALEKTCENHCPVLWGDKRSKCTANGSHYTKILTTRNAQKRAELAREIANLPERME